MEEDVPQYFSFAILGNEVRYELFGRRRASFVTQFVSITKAVLQRGEKAGKSQQKFENAS